MNSMVIKEILLISFLIFFFLKNQSLILYPLLMSKQTKNSLKILIKSFYISRTLLRHHYNVLRIVYIIWRREQQQTNDIPKEFRIYTYTHICSCHLIFKLPFQGLSCLYSLTYYS